MMAMHESGAVSMRTDRDAGGGGAGGGVSGAYTPKGSWFSGRISLTGRRRGGGGGTSSGLSGFLSSRSNAQSTGRSMMSTSRSMMTTARSDVNTGRYNDHTDADPEMIETRVFESSKQGQGEGSHNGGQEDNNNDERSPASRGGRLARRQDVEPHDEDAAEWKRVRPERRRRYVRACFGAVCSSGGRRRARRVWAARSRRSTIEARGSRASGRLLDERR